MKRRDLISLIALLTILTGSLQAQTSFLIGPEIGIQNSKMKVTNDLDASSLGGNVDYSGIFSYQGGISLGIQFAGKWAIISGLKYNAKGGKSTIESRDPNNPLGYIQNSDGTFTPVLGEIETEIKANFLSIPILARGQFGETFKVGLAIGPQINMGLGKVKETTEYNLENANLPTDEENTDYGTSTTNLLKKSHMSLLIQPFVSYELSPNSSLRFSVMFESGSNMVNENYVVQTNDGGSRNIDGTMKNSQFGAVFSYEYRFDFQTGTKY